MIFFCTATDVVITRAVDLPDFHLCTHMPHIRMYTILHDEQFFVAYAQMVHMIKLKEVVFQLNVF